MTAAGNNKTARNSMLGLAERALLILLMALLVDVAVYEPTRPVFAATGASVQDLSDDLDRLCAVKHEALDLGALARPSAVAISVRLTNFAPTPIAESAAIDTALPPIRIMSWPRLVDSIVAPVDRSHPCAVRAP